MDYTIAICTRNRANDLKQTIESIRSTSIPTDKRGELLVIDNGSSDNTRSIIESATFRDCDVRYFCEPKPGLSNARNSALRESRGDVILFTDDDVRPEGSWLDGMINPILNAKADVVCGQVRIADYLYRPWMTEQHRRFFADTGFEDYETDPSIIGANFAIGRHVLSKVPEFDTYLGAGALGFYEDSLFSRQLREAGFRFMVADVGKVIHCFNADRLLRSSLLNASQRLGRSIGYAYYHWDHVFPRPYLRQALLNYSYYLRASIKKSHSGTEGCSFRLMSAVIDVNIIKGYFLEKHQAPHYSRKGLKRF